MFQHTGRHIKHRPMCCPETKGVTPLLFGLSALKGGVSTNKEIQMNIILASSSPRRTALLQQIGISHHVIAAHIDEQALPHESPLDTVARLAQEKAAVIAAQHPQALIIAADTIGILNGKLLGKPQNADDAYTMLQAMSGREHQVATAFTIQYKDQKISQTHIAHVKMIKADEALLKAYIACGEGLDKAGAYAIQGQGAVLVESIVGDFYTVVGLPIAPICATLREFGIAPFTRS